MNRSILALESLESWSLTMLGEVIGINLPAGGVLDQESIAAFAYLVVSCLV